MRSSRDRARRDYAPATQPNRADNRLETRNDSRMGSRADNRSEKRPENRSDGRQAFKRSHFTPYSPQSEHNHKRIRPSAPYHGSQTVAWSPPAGSIGVKSNSISSGILVSTPKLSELRTSRRSDPNWPWDRHAKGYENVSAQALKLLGYATPESTYIDAAVPDEIMKIRNTKPLTAQMSWIVCQVGSKVYESAREAAIAFAKGAGSRPVGVRQVLEHDGESPNYGIQSDSKSGENRPENQKNNVFTDIHAVIVRDCNSPEAVEKQYGMRTVCIERIDTSEFVAKFETVPTTLHGNDSWLFPEESSGVPVIEVLNAYSLAKPEAADVLQAIMEMCSNIGYETISIWRSEDQLPYKVPRIYIVLRETDKAREAAAALGEMKLQGRPLITTLNYSVKTK